ncbi:MAG: insulinase family protein [candidate division Zixibacteria bacterium]|nr:insulinase family protein [candidate division Zixibacteria bacterium]
MKFFKIILLAITVLFLGAGYSFAGVDAEGNKSKGSEIIESFEFDPVEWDVPRIGKEVKREELKNGMVLFLMEDHELPLINIRALIRTGDIYVPGRLDGIAGLTGIVMRTGGTESLTAEELNDKLEFMAARLETGVGSESGYASLSVMSRDIDEGLQLFADVLMNPAFRDSQLTIEKGKIKEDIRRRNDTPQSILSREYSHLLYEGHPYGRILEWETVKALTSDDLKRFHEKYFKPNNMMMAVSGDFKTKDMINKIKKAFRKWKKDPVEFGDIPEVEYQFHPGVFLMDKDLNQSRLQIGKLGVKQGNPDEYAITIMNFILGGGSFTSRLTSRVRSDEGLAYSVGSSFSTGNRDYGTFTAYCQTKNESAHKAVGLILEEIEKMRDEPVEPEELQNAKDTYINGYIFNFANTSQVVNRLMELEYDNYPRDYFENYLDNIRSVTVDDIRRVAKKYLDTEEMTIMVIGRTGDFDGDMTDFGKVHDIVIKEPVLD